MKKKSEILKPKKKKKVNKKVKDIKAKKEDALILDDDITNEEEVIENSLEDLTEEELENLKKEFNAEAMPYMPLLRNYANKICNNELDADDLLQETYLRAFRFYNKFEKGTNCKAWLFRIMKNLFINEYRKNQKSPGKVDYEEIENFYESIKSNYTDSGDAQEKIYNNQLDDEVTYALNSLQDEFKTVIILCDIEGLSYEEIADFVQCPVGTIRSRLHRGRKILQQKLNSYARKKGYEVQDVAV
ncbi:MAG TPA: sigma-70 family RNA polymerase sigma factor [Ignavibacteria bacterium]|nr:sigma-70 family RNA polymerase sigma factor [Ignavibacteria bacterium]